MGMRRARLVNAASVSRLTAGLPAAVAALFIAIPQPATAAPPSTSSTTPAPATATAAGSGPSRTTAPDPASCICRAQGQDHELGATICLRGPRGPRIAKCVMVLNNTSWKFTNAPCAMAEASPWTAKRLPVAWLLTGN